VLSTLTFLIGDTHDSVINLKLQSEYEKHEDILRLSIHDSYKNCAYKVLGSFEWIYRLLKDGNTVPKYADENYTNNLSNNNVSHNQRTISGKQTTFENNVASIDWVVKVDDDMDVNYGNLIRNLEPHPLETDSTRDNDMSILCSAVLNNHVAEWRNDSMTRKW
jgi:hypothetical protein